MSTSQLRKEECDMYSLMDIELAEGLYAIHSCSTPSHFRTDTFSMLCQDNDYSLGWLADFYWFTRLQVQDDQQVHKLLSHEWISHGCSHKYYPRFWKRERIISGHSSCVTIGKNYFSFPWKSWNHQSHCSSVSNCDQYHWLWYPQQC